MTAVIGWIMIVLGLFVMCVPFFEGRLAGRRSIVLMAIANVLIGANILVGTYASRFSVPMLIVCAVYVIGILATSSRESVRRTKAVAVLGAATIIGIWAIYFLPIALSPLRLPLLVVGGVLGMAFSIAILVHGAQTVAKAQR
jgi:hypothetical protein